MATTTVPFRHDARQVAALLALPEITTFISDLDSLRWTGRPGFGTRALVGAALVKSLYCLPTWARTARLISEHAALRDAIGGAPSQWALYRHAAKLREHGDALANCIDRILARLRAARPEMGKVVAIDGSDLPAYGNGQRFVKRGGEERKRYADPDASWGHRSSISTRSGGGFYGHKIHALVCARTGLPLAWSVRTAKDPEVPEVPGLLDAAITRGFRPDVVIMDRGYDVEVAYGHAESRGIRPVIPLRETPGVKKGKAAPPKCDHGQWTFAGSDARRGASKWRCPTGECAPASVWVKASRLHPLIPRETDRFKNLYHQRGSVEREFGILKHEWGLLPLRVRRLPRVKLHVDLTILATLASACAW